MQSGLGPPHPAQVIVYDPSESGLTATDLQEAIDELAALIGTGGDFLTTTEGGGDVISTVASSGSTETVDLADGNVHDITLTADCTFTFTAPAAGRARAWTLFLREDGTGGHANDTVWPGSVIWAGGSAPTLDDTAGAVNVLTFVTLDGGSVWYGFPVGGGGGSGAVIVTDGTTTVNPATTIDFDPDYFDVLSPGAGVAEVTLLPDAIEEAGRWELAVIPGSPPDSLYADGDWLYIWVPG